MTKRILTIAFVAAFLALGAVAWFAIAQPMPTAGKAMLAASARRGETIRIYFTPLASTAIASDIGLGEAYHMAIVYTDANGNSFGASGGPSNLGAAQTPADAFDAMIDFTEAKPSSFGTLVADPRNDMAFREGSIGDVYTHGPSGLPYPHSLVARGLDLSAQWRTIIRTYARIGSLGLTYAPIEQNSKSLAAAALARAGLPLDHEPFFVPGAYTRLPLHR